MPAAFDPNAMALYLDPDFARAKPEERSLALGAIFDEHKAPEMRAKLSSANLTQERENFIRANTLHSGYDPEAIELYTSMPGFAKATPEKRAKALGAVFDEHIASKFGSADKDTVSAERDAYISRNLTQADRNEVYGGGSFALDTLTRLPGDALTYFAKAGRGALNMLGSGELLNTGPADEAMKRTATVGYTGDRTGWLDKRVDQKSREDAARELKYEGSLWGKGKYVDPTGAASSLAGSMAGNVPTIAGAVAAGAGGAGIGAMVSAPAMFFSAADDLTDSVLLKANDEMKRTQGRSLNDEEVADLVSRSRAHAAEYGLAEAGPETISNIISGAVAGKVLKIFGGTAAKAGAGLLSKETAKKVGKSAVAEGIDLAGEMGGETWTGKWEGGIEAQVGLRERAPTWGEAAAEQLPTTLAMFGMTRGAGMGLGYGLRKLAGERGIGSVPGVGDTSTLPGGGIDLSGAVKSEAELAYDAYAPGPVAPGIGPDRMRIERGTAQPTGQAQSGEFTSASPMGVMWNPTQPYSQPETPGRNPEMRVATSPWGPPSQVPVTPAVAQDVSGARGWEFMQPGVAWTPDAPIAVPPTPSVQGSGPSAPAFLSPDVRQSVALPVDVTGANRQDFLTAQGAARSPQPDQPSNTALAPGALWESPLTVAWDGSTNGELRSPLPVHPQPLIGQQAGTPGPSQPVAQPSPVAKAKLAKKAIQAKHKEQAAQQAVAQAQDLQQKAQVNPDFAPQAQAATQKAELAIADAQEAQAQVVEHVQGEQQKAVALQDELARQQELHARDQQAAEVAMAKQPTPPTQQGVKYAPMENHDISTVISDRQGGGLYNSMMMPDLKFRDILKAKVDHDADGVPYTTFKGKTYRIDGHRGDDGSMKLFATAPFSPKMAEKPKPEPKAKRARQEKAKLGDQLAAGANTSLDKAAEAVGRPATGRNGRTGIGDLIAKAGEADRQARSYEGAVTKPEPGSAQPPAAAKAREERAAQTKQAAVDVFDSVGRELYDAGMKGGDQDAVRQMGEQGKALFGTMLREAKANTKSYSTDGEFLVRKHMGDHDVVIARNGMVSVMPNHKDGFMGLREEQRKADERAARAARDEAEAKKNVEAKQKQRDEEAAAKAAEPAPEVKTRKKGDARKAVDETAPKGRPVEDVQAQVDVIAANWKNAPQIVVVNGHEDLLRNIPRSMHEDANEHEGKIVGMYANGVVYIDASLAKDEHHTESTLIHEALRHFGLREALGDQYNDIMLQAWSNPRVQQAVLLEISRDYGLKMKDIAVSEPTKIMAVDEALARMDENNSAVRKVLDKVIAAVNKWMRSIGIKTEFTDAEVRELIRSAADAVRGGLAKKVDPLADRRGAWRSEAIDVGEGTAKAGDVVDILKGHIDRLKEIVPCLG